MPEYFPENNTPLWSDTEVRSLQKISSSLDNLSTGGAGGIIGSFPTDAFGRLKVSNPFTLFDSSHRYRDNGLWSTATSGVGSAATFSANQGLIELTIPSTAGAYVIRETNKVFSYQPGKSLMTMNTFIMNSAKTNLRQRVGYFNDENGMFLELYGNALTFVERSLSTGTETAIPQADWNGDKLDGTGPSGITLDISKAQILWMDIEWLGLGTVRMGFVINGQLITCHSFHHANLITTTYITTASLPLRYEIQNVISASIPATSSTLKQVCSTVISDGGYQLSGAQQAVGIAVKTPRVLATSGTFYPIISLRLKSLQNTPASAVDRTDAITILTAASIMPNTSAGNPNHNWRLVQSTVTTGGAWVSAGDDSSVEYNITGTSVNQTAGRVLASGYVASSNQGISSVDILKEALFKSQLERNGLTGVASELTLEVAASKDAAEVLGSLDWEEISR
jgi:hypothetical protein